MTSTPSAPAFSHFHLTENVFDDIAAGVLDPAQVALLLSAERSRRLLLLHHVLAAGLADPARLGPLGSPAGTQALLAELEARHPAAIEDLLLQPNTGMWLAYTVRSLEGGRPAGRPLWAQLGSVSAFAAAAAVAARVPFRLDVPLEHGQVFLPGLGQADLSHLAPGEFGIATVHGGLDALTVQVPGGSLQIPLPLSQDHDHWQAIPVLEAVAASGPVLRVSLDWLDPAPQRVGLPTPMRLSAADLTEWEKLIGAAWQVLADDHPDAAATLAAGLKTLIPLVGDGSGPTAGSSSDGFGAAATVLLPDPADFASALLHEFMHSALNGLMHLVELCRRDPQGSTYYAPWRDDPRPLRGMLHGAYAFSAVTRFWQVRLHLDEGDAARRAELEFAIWRRHTRSVLDQLAVSQGLTEWGTRMVQRLQEQAEGWDQQAVSAEAERLARLAAGSHLATWRAHHVQVDQDWTERAAKAWLAGDLAPRATAAAIATDATARGLSAVLTLARSAYAPTITALPALIETAQRLDETGADRLLVQGADAAAAARYLARIDEDPDDARPWGGLGIALATPETGQNDSSAVLLQQHPERVRAVYRRLRSSDAPRPDVVDLAFWLAENSQVRV